MGFTRKHASEIWPIIKAFGEGKTIIYENNKFGVHENNFDFTKSACKYQVVESRPYKNIDEAKKALGKSIRLNNGAFTYEITGINEKELIIKVDNLSYYYSFENMFKSGKFTDGSVVGIEA